MELTFLLFICTLIVNAAYIIIPTILFYRLRMIINIQKRCRPLLIVSAFATFIATSALISYLTVFLPYQMHCGIFISVIHIFIPIYLFSYLVRVSPSIICIDNKSIQLIYENCRTRLAFESGNEEILSSITKLEFFSEYFFSFYRSKRQKSIITLVNK